MLLLVPYVSMINALAGYGIYHQLISDPAFACFVYLSATQVHPGLHVLPPSQLIPRSQSTVRSQLTFR